MVTETELETLGAFEISFKMLQIAKNNEKHNVLLNAGRGNPNWINKKSRLAFSRLLHYGVLESEHTLNYGDMAGYTIKNGIYDRVIGNMQNDDIDNFLKIAFKYCIDSLKIDKDELMFEFINGIVGNNYPVPSRCLVNTEKILNAYLQSTLYNGVKLQDNTQIMPTEGGTAAMCYLFKSLRHNGLLNDGDKIAINTPIFTPYIQIPHLTGFDMVEIDLKSTEENDWNIDPKEFEKLKDPQIKAFFLVNPSNPGSRALSSSDLEYLRDVISNRKDLIIVTDDVYGTFVEGFQTVYSVAPYNTILVYSYSKLFGVTGWRTGLIAMNKENVCDTLLKKLSKEKLEELHKDYSIITIEPEKLPFIERVCADSRDIGLYHTSGLSTPQQIFMALMSLTHLVVACKDVYFEKSREIVANRYSDLFGGLGIKCDDSKLNAKYYSLIDIYDIATKIYDKDFSDWLKNNFEQIDFLYKLASQDGVVLMDGVGFGAKAGTVRVSQANLPDTAYTKIAKRMLDILNEYHQKYLEK